MVILIIVEGVCLLDLDFSIEYVLLYSEIKLGNI